MIAIRSPADLKRSRLPENLHRAVSEVLANIQDAHGEAYNPENDGHIIVITPNDNDVSLAERLGSPYQDSMFEGISYDRDTRTWHVVYLLNNQCAMSLIISDAEWLDPVIRQRICREENLQQAQ